MTMKISEYVSYALLIVLLAISVGLVYRPGKPAEETVSITLSDFPLQLGKWGARNVQLSDEVLSTLGAREYLLREYTCGDKTLTLYLTYFNTGSGALTHNPEKCYTASGWTFLDRNKVNVPDARVALSSTVARGDQRQIVIYWYQDRARVLVSKARHISSVISGALMGRPMQTLVASVSARIDTSGSDGLEEELAAFSGLVMDALAKKMPL